MKNLKIIKKELPNKISLLIDVGAHRGETIDFFNKYFKIKKKILFEPNIECYEYLKKKFKKDIIYPFALSDKNSEGIFKIGQLSYMSTLNKINPNSFYTYFKNIIIFIFFFNSKIYPKKYKVKIKRLDAITEIKKSKKIDLIKIDTEGHELNVIKGMGKIIDKTKLILFEYHYDSSIIKKYNFDDINNYLKTKGFMVISKNKMIFRQGYEYIFKKVA